MTINVERWIVANGGSSSGTFGEGEGDTITITAQTTQLSRGATIAAASTSSGSQP
jgi:hypothetical protein